MNIYSKIILIPAFFLLACGETHDDSPEMTQAEVLDATTHIVNLKQGELEIDAEWTLPYEIELDGGWVKDTESEKPFYETIGWFEHKSKSRFLLRIYKVYEVSENTPHLDGTPPDWADSIECAIEMDNIKEGHGYVMLKPVVRDSGINDADLFGEATTEKYHMVLTGHIYNSFSVYDFAQLIASIEGIELVDPDKYLPEL